MENTVRQPEKHFEAKIAKQIEENECGEEEVEKRRWKTKRKESTGC